VFSRSVGLFVEQLLPGLDPVAPGHADVLAIGDVGGRSVQLHVWPQNNASAADDGAG
jgi:hypothetical protein